MWIKKAYIGLMFQIISRGLCALSRVDKQARDTVSELPEGFVIEMQVMRTHQGFKIKRCADNVFARVSPNTPVDLSIKFKHSEHALAVFLFQTSAAEAFTKDRVIADGDLAAAMRLVRILDRMQSVILPKFIAKRAVKRYPPNLPILQKLFLFVKVYASMGVFLFAGYQS